MRKKISKTRIGLVHGIESIEELNKNSLDLLPTIALILYQGLAKILEINFENSYKNVNRIHPIKVGELIALQGYLKTSDKPNEDNYYPHIYVENGTNNMTINTYGFDLVDIKHLVFGEAIESFDVKEKLIHG